MPSATTGTGKILDRLAAEPQTKFVMKKKNVTNCQFSSWYPALKNITIKSHMLPIPHEVLAYLNADGLVLPEGSSPAVDRGQFEAHSDDEVDWESDDNMPTAKVPCFTEFDNQIRNCIKSLGGKIFPKLNWSSPKDSAWISADGTLSCSCPGDIYLLLKSSDFVTHDITQPFLKCVDYNGEDEIDIKFVLVLREWVDINPAGEFRCFVKDNKLIGICQRHNNSYFPFMKDQKDNIISEVSSFYRHSIYGNFPDPDYVFDVYRKSKGRLLLIDINPFGRVTDGLMFDWEELESDGPLSSTFAENEETESSSEIPVFRFVRCPAGVQPHPYSSNALPRDVVDVTRGEDPYKLIDMLQLKTRNLQEESSDEDT